MTSSAREDERPTQHSWTFFAPLWRWREGSWHFVTVPEDISDEIDEISAGLTGGFGSVRVDVCCGATVWRTSVFPSAEHKAFILPVKAAVRKSEGLAEGHAAHVTLTLLVEPK